MQISCNRELIKKTQCPMFLDWIISNFNTNKRILDIGCGDKWYHPFLNNTKIVSVDYWPDVNPDYVLDLETNELPFDDNSFDIVFMFDVIEHLEKERGFEILKQCKRIAS